MPALHLFHRRTLLAGDDLQLPSIAWGASFAVQLFGFLPCLLYYTIALLLLTSSSSISISLLSLASLSFPEEYFDDGSLNDNLVVDTRQLYYDYYSSTNDDAEDAYNSNAQSIMQSAECNTSTSGYTDMRFPHVILVYLIGMAIYTSTSIYYERRMFQLSSIGTPTINTHLRNAPLAKLIEFKMTSLAGMNFILLVHGIFITCIFVREYIQCFPTIWWIVWASSFLLQSVQCLLTMTTLVSLWRVHPVTIVPASSPSNNNVTTASDFYQRHHADTTIPFHHTHNNIEIAEEIWRSRCQGCCRIMAISTCFVFGGRGIVSHAAEDGGGGGEKFYGDIARVLADYFADFGDYDNTTLDGGGIGLDVVPSDIGLGILLLRHIQAQRKMLAQRDALQQRGQQMDAGAVSLRASTDRNTLLFRRSTSQLSSSPSADCESAVPPHTEEEAYRSFSRTVLSPTNSEHYALIEEGAHFSRHQLAIYTWILYYYQFPVSGTFRLIGRKIRSKLKHNANTLRTESNVGISRETNYTGLGSGNIQDIMNQETIVGDNFLHLHEATLLAHAKLAKSEIAYATFESGGFYETPYCIVIDRKWKSVVLSIRGSLTLEDCVVDCLLDPSPLEALGEKYGFSGAGQYCHGGVLECTSWLHDDLMRHRILQTLLLGDNAEFSDYTLRIVGHSLGAGIGVILSLILRNTFPNLRCICYSPPGGLLTWDIATECSEFVTSFVLDSDIVPRLSVHNMERLRDEVLHLIARVKVSKYEIAQRLFRHGGLCCGEVEPDDLDYLIQQNEDMLYAPDTIPESNFLRQLRQFEIMQQERRTRRGIARSIALYPPGKIIHLVKTSSPKRNTCCVGSESYYTPIQKENDDFNEIEISPTLWTDHFPNRMCNEMEQLAKRFGIDVTVD